MSLRYSALSTSYLAKLTADFHSVCQDVIKRAMNVCFWGGVFNRSTQHLLILLEEEVCDGGDCTDMVHAAAEG